MTLNIKAWREALAKKPVARVPFTPASAGDSVSLMERAARARALVAAQTQAHAGLGALGTLGALMGVPPSLDQQLLFQRLTDQRNQSASACRQVPNTWLNQPRDAKGRFSRRTA